MTDRGCRVYPFLVGLTALILPAYAVADSVAFSMSVEEFCNLSPRDQKAILASAFEYRLQHAKNIYYESQTRLGIYEYSDGHLGKQLIGLQGANYRQWRLGNSYRMEYERGGGPEVKKPDTFGSSSLDSVTGVVKSSARRAESQRLVGRIDTVQNPILEENRYRYWLDGANVMHADTQREPLGEYVIRYLVDHKEGYTVEAPIDQDKVRLILPWKPIHSDRPLGQREFVLVPRKGFLPVSGKGRWETEPVDGKTVWQTEEFTVEASQLVKDVWMPTHLRELTRGSSQRPNRIALWVTKVTKMEAGMVTPKDLETPFPPGIKVVDATKAVSYVVGENGEPTRIERLLGARPETAMRAPPSSTEGRSWRVREYALPLTGAGLVVIAGVLAVFRFRGMRRASDVAG
jgi:hypothetical protein